MKKYAGALLFFITVSTQAMDFDVWNGFPQAVRSTARDQEVVSAAHSVIASITNLAGLYAQKILPVLTGKQKENCVSLLTQLQGLVQKMNTLSQGGADIVQIQTQIQAMWQEFLITQLPLILVLQQEAANQVAQSKKSAQGIVSQGYAFVDNLLNQMISKLQG